MNVQDLLLNSELNSYSSFVLSIEERSLLRNSLILLQNENHFRNIYFWGKIIGIENKYFVCFGYNKDALNDRKFYYSMDGFSWGILPASSPENKALPMVSKNPFTGDPAHLANLQNGSSNKISIENIKEEDRLAATISLINEETLILPRGALFKNCNMMVIENEHFQGLEKEESCHLESYVHNRIPKKKWNTNLLKRADFSYEMDFLDTIDIDIPKSSWSLQFEDGGKIVRLRNLFWIGMTFIHIIGTNKYYFNYTGYGRKNIDVPFML